MENIKEFVLKHFEKILIAIILVAAFIGTYLVEEKAVVLNFYYLPVLAAGYFLGRRFGLLTAIFSILVVVISALFFPSHFFGGQEFIKGFTQLASWGGFLILASIAVGTLYEQNESRLQDLRNAYIGVLEILSKNPGRGAVLSDSKNFGILGLLLFIVFGNISYFGKKFGKRGE